MSATAASRPTVRRGFVEIAEGQVHYRFAGPAEGRALVMIHASPGSSRMLLPLIEAVAALDPSRRIIATDTLGNGDSVPPSVAKPDLAHFADAHRRALDALGVEACDLYGSHTGAGIAAEIAIAAPARVRALVLDGMSLYDDAEREEMLARYAPGIQPDLNGSQLNWVWHFVRDTYLFWPWFKRDRAHVRANGLPDAAVLHAKAVEVLKALTTYHLSYQASIGYDKAGRLPLLRVPTMVACAPDDMLFPYLDRIAALVQHAARREVAGTASAEAASRTAAEILRFLDPEQRR